MLIHLLLRRFSSSLDVVDSGKVDALFIRGMMQVLPFEFFFQLILEQGYGWNCVRILRVILHALAYYLAYRTNKLIDL